MKLGQEELNWMKKKVRGISDNFVEEERSSFGQGLDRATQETLNIISRLESLLGEDKSTIKEEPKVRVKTLIGNGPIILEEKINEFLEGQEYSDIIGIDWKNIGNKRDNMVIFYANITYTEKQEANLNG